MVEPTPLGGLGLARKTAAFYDMDGTLLHGNVTDHYLYYAQTDPDLASRARRMLEFTIKAPYFWAVDRIDRRMFNEVFYKSYEGLTEDRLVILGEELFQKVLSKRLYPNAKKLVDADRALGRQLVLLTGAIEAVAKPVARHLGIETVVATKLEFKENSICTGNLLPPVMAGPEKAQYVRRFAEANDIDLEHSVAYADDAADLPLLSCVGRPVAVNPDLRLAATARSHRWPIIELGTDETLARKVWRESRNAFDVARELAEKARKEGEARWEQREEVVDRAKRLVGTLSQLAGQARDAANERVKKAVQERTTTPPKEEKK